jgi:hypothetical protein
MPMGAPRTVSKTERRGQQEKHASETSPGQQKSAKGPSNKSKEVQKAKGVSAMHSMRKTPTLAAVSRSSNVPDANPEKEPWQIQNAALKAKFGGEGWKPRKRLSPDALDGIRALHAKDPETFSTERVASEFKVSPEAIRRILKGKWRPSPEEQEDRLKRWDRRGEKIWTAMAEQGIRPPKKWREMGVGRAEKGEIPKWKERKTKGKSEVIQDDVPFVGDALGEQHFPVVDATDADPDVPFVGARAVHK